MDENTAENGAELAAEALSNGALESEPSCEDEHAMEQAADAEARLAMLSGRVAELEQDLVTARESLEASELARAVDAAVAGSGAVDEETVRVLLAREMDSSPEASAAEAVAALKDRTPALFGSAAGAGASARSARLGSRAPAGLEAARTAAKEGDRASLLAYLRLRRESAAHGG